MLGFRAAYAHKTMKIYRESFTLFNFLCCLDAAPAPASYSSTSRPSILSVAVIELLTMSSRRQPVEAVLMDPEVAALSNSIAKELRPGDIIQARPFFDGQLIVLSVRANERGAIVFVKAANPKNNAAFNLNLNNYFEADKNQVTLLQKASPVPEDEGGAAPTEAADDEGSAAAREAAHGDAPDPEDEGGGTAATEAADGDAPDPEVEGGAAATEAADGDAPDPEYEGGAAATEAADGDAPDPEDEGGAAATEAADGDAPDPESCSFCSPV